MDTKRTHTPGPWEAGNMTGDHTVVISTHESSQADCWIAMVYMGYGMCKGDIPKAVDEVIANARLIAAAPTLLAALEKIVSDGDYTNPEEMKRIARAAIAQADNSI